MQPSALYRAGISSYQRSIESVPLGPEGNPRHLLRSVQPFCSSRRCQSWGIISFLHTVLAGDLYFTCLSYLETLNSLWSFHSFRQNFLIPLRFLICFFFIFLIDHRLWYGGRADLVQSNAPNYQSLTSPILLYVSWLNWFFSSEYSELPVYIFWIYFLVCKFA